MRAALILFVMLLPAIVYVGYLMVRRGEKGEDAAVERRWRLAGLLLIAGEVVAAGLLAWWLIGAGASKDMIYLPPYYEDGRMVPGRFVERPES